MTSYLNMDYVSKMKYNRDKDVVFVYKPDSIWNEKEYVHEIHHLEQTVPFAISAIEDRSLYNRDDGILTVYDMNEHNELKFYNEDKYWNMELKEDFLNSTNGMWINGFNDKRSGSIFSYHAKANEESTLMVSLSSYTLLTPKFIKIYLSNQLTNLSFLSFVANESGN